MTTASPTNAAASPRVPASNSHLMEDAIRSFKRAHNITELARQMGRNPTTLLDKLNPDREDHVLTLAEAMALTHNTGDEGLLRAWAAERGCALVKLPDSDLSDEELSDQMLMIQELFGVFAREIREARADGVFDPAEIARIRTAAVQLVRQALSTTAEIESSVREFPGVVNG